MIVFAVVPIFLLVFALPSFLEHRKNRAILSLDTIQETVRNDREYVLTKRLYASCFVTIGLSFLISLSDLNSLPGNASSQILTSLILPCIQVIAIWSLIYSLDRALITAVRFNYFSLTIGGVVFLVIGIALVKSVLPFTSSLEYLALSIGFTQYLIFLFGTIAHVKTVKRARGELRELLLNLQREELSTAERANDTLNRSEYT